MQSRRLATDRRTKSEQASRQAGCRSCLERSGLRLLPLQRASAARAEDRQVQTPRLERTNFHATQRTYNGRNATDVSNATAATTDEATDPDFDTRSF